MVTLLGWRVTVENRGRLAESAPAVLMATHKSNLDIVVYGGLFPRRAVVIGKKEIVKIPVFGWFFRVAGNILLDRRDLASAIASIAAAAARVRAERISVWVFPEGHRNGGPTLLPFKKGSFHLAIAAQVPIVPIVCTPLHDLLDGHRLLVFPGRIRLRVLPPIPTEGLGEEDLETLVARCTPGCRRPGAQLAAETAEHTGWVWRRSPRGRHRRKKDTPRMNATPRPRIRFAAAFGFGLVHAAALGVLALDFSWEGVALCLGSYYLRMFAITAGFHRYFAHRTYRMNRFWQFLMAFLGQTAAQKGVLWWAAHHRHHHRFSDQPEDIHSPVQKGFWWSHMGWILADEYEETQLEAIRDFAKFPELVWLDRNQFLAPMLYGLGLWLAFSWTGLFWGFFLSTVLLWHGTFAINSVMHVFGKRVFETRDTSRNSFLMALVTMGEGWHNNHHHFQASAAQGFLWWQVDPSLYLLRLGRLARDREGPAPGPGEGRLPRPRAGCLALLVPDVRESARCVRLRPGGLGRPRRTALAAWADRRETALDRRLKGSPSWRYPASAPRPSSRS